MWYDVTHTYGGNMTRLRNQGHRHLFANMISRLVGNGEWNERTDFISSKAHACMAHAATSGRQLLESL